MNKNEPNNIERRSVELRADKESRMIEGYAVVWESVGHPYRNDPDFEEIIARGAITDETIATSTVLALLNHDQGKVLARSKKGKGSLTLTIDEKGVKYAFSAPKTALGDELLEYIERGDITTSSFGFIMDWNDPEACKVEQWSGGKYRQTIYKVKDLFDVSPVFESAYEDTTCGTKRSQEIRSACESLNEYFNGLKSELENI